MTIKLYKMDLSPPSRSVMMLIEILGLPVELIDLDLLKEEHLTPERLKKSSLHTVPVLEDGDLVIHDSHGILTYLIDTYGKDDHLYPKDVTLRSLVDEKLLFDTGILLPAMRNISFVAVMEGKRKPDPERIEEVEEAYGFLEEFLSDSVFLALDHFTIADIAAIATVIALTHVVPINAEKYVKTNAWIETMKQMDFVKKVNAPGDEIFATMIKNCIDL